MSATGKTPNYNLPYYESSDFTNWGDFNNAMLKIDKVMHQNATSVDTQAAKLDELTTQVQNLSEGQETLVNQSNTLSQRVSQNETTITNLETHMRDVDEQIAGLQQEQSSITDSLNQVSTLVGTQGTEISAVQSSITTLTQATTNLEKDIQEESGNVAAVQADVTTLQNQTKNLKDQMIEVQNIQGTTTANLNQLTEKTDQNTTNISTLNRDTHYNTENISTIQNTLETVEDKLTTLQTMVTNQQNTINQMQSEIGNLGGSQYFQFVGSIGPDSSSTFQAVINSAGNGFQLDDTSDTLRDGDVYYIYISVTEMTQATMPKFIAPRTTTATPLFPGYPIFKFANGSCYGTIPLNWEGTQSSGGSKYMDFIWYSLINISGNLDCAYESIPTTSKINGAIYQIKTRR